MQQIVGLWEWKQKGEESSETVTKDLIQDRELQVSNVSAGIREKRMILKFEKNN